MTYPTVLDVARDEVHDFHCKDLFVLGSVPQYDAAQVVYWASSRCLCRFPYEAFRENLVTDVNVTILCVSSDNEYFSSLWTVAVLLCIYYTDFGYLSSLWLSNG
ncbi:hypothetical protein E2542_SST01572 [Spatholobus suberectus]|nr:hypothetical protein E2542_SST01572 [Spatholobus suberectus]